MKGYRPDGGDFQFVSNGYKCAVAVTFYDEASRGDFNLYMTKQKVAGGATAEFQDWELVHSMDYIDRGKYPDAKACMADFLATANQKLKDKTGGSVPQVPAGFLEHLEWICRYGLAFNGQTNEVILK
jgi:hypothetical protein